MKTGMLKLVATSAVAVMGMSGAAMADQVEPMEVPVPRDEVVVADEPAPAPCDCDTSPNQGNVSVAAGLGVRTAYFFRGIMQERDGAILNGWAELAFKLWESAEGQSLSLFGGTWNSVHSNKTGFQSGPSNWFESDGYVGLAIGLTEYLTTDLTYTAYTSPNGAFQTIQEFDVKLRIDDSVWLGDFATNPYVQWAFEIDNTRFGNEEGVYVELGAAPSYELPNGIGLSMPLALGLAVDDYYETPQGEDTFGFFDFGFEVDVPLPIDEAYGSWSAMAGFHGVALSGDLADVNRRDGFMPWGIAGIRMEY